MACSSLAGFQSGSNITSLLAPIKFKPQPPALLLNMKINSGLCGKRQTWIKLETAILSLAVLIWQVLHTEGLLNRSTIFALFLMDMVPSSRTYKYLGYTACTTIRLLRPLEYPTQKKKIFHNSLVTRAWALGAFAEGQRFSAE